jgi:hypothetical protein
MTDLCGLPLYESYFLTISETRQRHWRERLFTRPWQPLKRWTVIQKPDPHVYRMERGFVAHPQTIATLRHSILKRS